MTPIAIAYLIAILALIALGFVVARHQLLIRRHRACKQTLQRVVEERNRARWDLLQQ